MLIIVEIINNINVIVRIIIENKLVDFIENFSKYHFFILIIYIINVKIIIGIVISSNIAPKNLLKTILLNEL